MTSKVRPVVRPKLTPLPDPDEDRMQQYPHFIRAGSILRAYFRHALGRNDVLVSGDGYLCRRAGEARSSPRPDVMVALDLPFDPAIIEEANGYTIEEIGQPPDFLLEVGSSTTSRRDYPVKRDIYAGMGVREYWRFDHTGGRYHDAALAGDVLVDGQYQRIHIVEGADGIHRGYSAALGLELHWEERQLRFFDRATGEYVPDMEESWGQRDAALAAHRQEADERRQVESQLRQSEVQRRQSESQLQQAEAGRHQETVARQQAGAERDAALNRARELEEAMRRLKGEQ